jgi:50S ribosome-binding GTPase
MWTVVALGIVNAGKSLLLSALANQRGLFPDGDLPRVTRTVKRHAVGPLLLVDTPGLDADDAEADLAMREAVAADIVLWCHSLRVGELHATELAILRRYHEHSGTIWKTCMVRTHEDNVAGEDDVQAISARITHQLKEVFGVRFHATGEMPPEPKSGKRRQRPFHVGVGTYWRAHDFKGKQRQHLLRRSGVPRLRSFLEQLANKCTGEGH